MIEYGMAAANFLRTLPPPLAADKNMQALATVIAEEMETLASETQLAQIYTRIDELDEVTLDQLAADFKVDWWRPDSSLAEKRQAIKDSWYIHQHIGTKSAVEKAVGDYLGDGKVEEWYEYGGQPYHFRISARDNNKILANYAEFMAVMGVVQRRGAVLEHIAAQLVHYCDIYTGIITRCKKTIRIHMDPVDVNTEDQILTTELGEILTDEAGKTLIL